MVGLLEALLGSLAAGADGLGAVADERARRVHVVQLGAVLVNTAEQHRHTEWPGLPRVRRGQRGHRGHRVNGSQGL